MWWDEQRGRVLGPGAPFTLTWRWRVEPRSGSGWGEDGPTDSGHAARQESRSSWSRSPHPGSSAALADPPPPGEGGAAQARSRLGGGRPGVARPGPSFLVVGALAVSLAGCAGGSGFRPLYGPAAGGSGSLVAAELAAVEIVPLEGRVGQQVRNQLIFFFSGGGRAAPPRYRLEITVTESNLAAIADPFSGRPEVVSLTLDASFALRPAGAGPSAPPVVKGTSFARASYTASLQRFANIRAQRDAEDRAAKVLAEQIRTRIAGYLATGQ